MKFVAPAGTPIALADLVCGLANGLTGPQCHAELTSLLMQLTETAHAWPVISGRAGMTLVLRAMARANSDTRRREIVIPGYTCYSVPAAIERAGLRVRLCDVDPATLSMDPEKLRRMDFSSVLAVVSANLYGIPNLLTEIESIATANGIYMLDDAAQALGARYQSRAVGGFGDAGLFSFDKGKNITTIQGGAIVARQGALANAIEAEYNDLPPSSLVDTVLFASKLAAYSFMLRPKLYGLAQNALRSSLGRTDYETPSPMKRFSPTLAGVALRLLKKLDAINGTRISNARSIVEALLHSTHVSLAEIPLGADAVYCRLPVFAKDPQQRQAIVDVLNQQGIGATRSYPDALVDVPEVRRIMDGVPDQPGARYVASTIITLPTHAYSTPGLAKGISAAIAGMPRGRGPSHSAIFADAATVEGQCAKH